jgi:rRNA maturation endonuclease Nob1
LLAGGDPRATPDDEVYITASVQGEIRNQDDRDRLETLRATGLKVKEPTPDALRTIEEASKVTGDGKRLSAVDKELLALALEMGAELLTDDRSMQNLAASLKIPYRGFAQTEIKGLWHWQSHWRCIGCGRTYESEVPQGVCRVCGHEVKKKHWRVPKGEAAGKLKRGSR